MAPDARDVETCSVCGSQFKRSFLRHHQRSKHPEDIPRKIGRNIICCVCKAQFSFRQQFRDHVSETHGKIESKELKFNSIEEFDSWLQSEENNIKIHFTKFREPRKLSNGNTRVSYYCQYDNGGNNKIIPHDKRKRALKYQGSYKLSGCCPAEIIVEKKKRTGRVYVTYYVSHLGHNASLAHFYLKFEQRKEFADKIRAGVSFNKILDEVRENVQPDSLRREDFISQQTLYNIANEFGIENWKRTEDDTTTLAVWIEEMKKSKYNAVCLSKMQGDEDEHLAVNDFFLVIMTQIQAKMLCDFGHRMICIDGTHGTDQYDFELTTILVVDDHEEGFPVAHLICNRKDQGAMEVFFESVRAKIGRSLTPSVFMSDDYPAYFNAWIKVMMPEKPPKKLLSTWHVDKNWREALSKIECRKGEAKIKQVEVYQVLRFLLEEKDETVFTQSLEVAVNDLLTDESTRSFGKYFQSYYANRPETWAYCYRIDAGMNTNMRIENYHRLLKNIHHNETKMKRLDACVNTLMKIVRDRTHERFMKLMHIKAPNIIKKINSAHRKSCEIKDEDVTERDDSYCEVKSQSDSGSSYAVKKEYETCPYNCEVICKACNVCQHLYSCTCEDFLIKTRMCKHIHKVCTFLRSRNNVPNPLDSICEVEIAMDHEYDIIEVMQPTPEKEADTDWYKLAVQEWKTYSEMVTTLLECSETPLFGVKKLINATKRFLIQHKQLHNPTKKSLSPINKKNKNLHTVSKKLLSTRKEI